jgi:superfamily I DNA/RNA helicase
VERLLLADSQDSHAPGEGFKRNEVTLMTLHGSKGLEYDCVFLVGMEEELLPHKKTIIDNSDISEERRLCYVGITRARKKLVMTYAKERKIYGKMIPRFKSRFIIEKTELFREVDRTNFGDMSENEIVEHKRNFFNNLMDSLK